MSQQKPTLGYWQIRGLGNPIRFLLHFLQIDYGEKYYKEEVDKLRWLNDKETLGLPFPNLPYLLDGDNKVTETRAIMKHLCRTHKPDLLGNSSGTQSQRIDMVDNFMYDCLYSGLAPVVYEYTEEKRNKWIGEDEPRKLRYLSEFMKDSQWSTGNDLTYVDSVDFLTYEVLYQMTVFNPTCLDKFPTLKEYMDRFERLPAIQKFMSSDLFLKSPCFGPTATYKM